MDYYDLPSFVNDALCAQEDQAYGEAESIIAEAQPLLNDAVARVKYLAGRIRVWSLSVLECAAGEYDLCNYNMWLADDSKELQKIDKVISEFLEFKKQFENDVNYQNYRQMVAA